MGTDHHLILEILQDKKIVDDNRLIGEVVLRQREKGYGYYRIGETLKAPTILMGLNESTLSELNESQYEDCESALEKNNSTCLSRF